MQIKTYLQNYQPIIYRTFVNAIESEKLSHAYLLSGSVGTPLKESAIYLAKSIDGVYDDDPNVNKNAKRFAKLTYHEILVKQLHVMDATAASLCEENNVKTIVFDADVPGNVYKVLEDPTIGTIIEKSIRNTDVLGYADNYKFYLLLPKTKVKGILWHSTGANNPNLSRYV